MIGRHTLRVAGALASLWFAPGAQAACMVVGDSVGVGIGMALNGVCSTSAKVGISSSAVAERVQAGEHWTIASLGSNDFPRSIAPAQRAQSEIRVRAALASVLAKTGSRLLLVLPANGARGLVQGWAAANGVRTVSFAPGRDGIHPRSYTALAREIRRKIGA
jgi:hypothetical protein